MFDERQVPWIEKYRPANLSKICGHDEIIGTIRKFIGAGQIPNLLLHGPAGTGKTTTAVAVCKQLFGEVHYRMSTLELNASDDRGIDIIRTNVKSFIQSTSFGSFTFEEQDEKELGGLNCSGLTVDAAELAMLKMIRRRYKIVILDEADSMTQAAQFALRRMIEKYSDSVRFFLICNFANKIIPALVSRCTSFRFSSLPPEHAAECVQKIAVDENIEIDYDAMNALQKIANGDLRKVINMLQSLCIMERAKTREANKTENSSNTAAGMIAGMTTEGTVPAATSNDLRIKITELQIYRSMGECTPKEVEKLVYDLLTGNDYDSMVKSLVTQKSNLPSLLAPMHEVFTKIKYQTLEQRLKVVEALAKIEFRFGQGCLNEEFEAAFLVNEILMLRKAWTV